ncbi:MAG: polymer-forming cytoskeletal protein [Deltaproteobacteria bacterium]|nr:polymer-forming cytoskeletal protein [Deltaproteobacteria bacterium]
MISKKESSANSEDINAFLGKGTDFNGKLTFEGTVRLDGKFSGEIFSPGILIIGESANVSADINVNTLILSGELTGNIEAKTRVEIHAPGKLYGNITSPVLVIDEGVIFDGGCNMKKKDNNKVSILERKEEEKAVKS